MKVTVVGKLTSHFVADYLHDPDGTMVSQSNQYLVTGFSPKLKSSWSCSHMNCCQHYMLHINLNIIYIHLIILNLTLKGFQESSNYFKSYQVNKIEYFAGLYFNLNLHLNLNIKQDFQVDSQFSALLC